MPHYQTSQNCDNFLSERSSTGLHAPPGGGSSFGSGLGFGGDDNVERSVTTGLPINQGKRDPNAPSEQAHGFRAKGSNAHANGANQNCGNFLTDRPTSKVLAAPGGGSSFGSGLSFGGDDNVERSVTTGLPINQGKRDPNAPSEQAHGFRAKGSNAHANGANQNCGNFLTDRPTSKVLAAPGGSSSFGTGLSFGGDDTSAIKKSTKRDPNARSTAMAHGFRAKGSNAHASGANQNCGNHLTDRPTSRVLAPPGGGSSISFGGDAPAPVENKPAPAPVAAPVAAPLADVSNKPAESASIFNMAKPNEAAHGFRAKGSNAHANGANQNCGNFLTDRPTSRVLAPPGGGSSISFG